MSNTDEQNNQNINDPIHGVKLIDMLEFLVAQIGWKELGIKIKIKCFTDDPSIKSSLTFIRKTAWAREKVERLYVQMARKKMRKPSFKKPNDNTETE